MTTTLEQAQQNAVFLYDTYIHPCFDISKIIGTEIILDLDYEIADHIRQQGHDWMLTDTKSGDQTVIILLEMVDDSTFLTALVQNIVAISIQTRKAIDADENNK